MPSTLTGRFRAKLENGSRTRRKSRLFSLTQAILVIALILLCARFVTVLVTSFREEPAFTAPKTIYLPQRELEHQMAVTEFQNAAATPATIPALTTESLLANMPALPQIPNVDFTPVENEAHGVGIRCPLRRIRPDGRTRSPQFAGLQRFFPWYHRRGGSLRHHCRCIRFVRSCCRSAGMDLMSSTKKQKTDKESQCQYPFWFIQHVRAYDTFQDDLIPATVPIRSSPLNGWIKSSKKIGKIRQLVRQ